ncbi:cation:proton antiporter [Microbacterium gorillae]|uniref:cation:proton antiporter n=1 Tax=Microbacterium gorillae TaxID=1231063 RepID=UPI000B9C6D1C|nr:sodium:proton antiporter [Microbacterium gorillae]
MITIDLIDLVLIVVAGVIVIAVTTALAPKVGVAGPLVLLLLGIGFSLLPFTPVFTLDQEWILVGILPPLLYAAAVSLPAMEFRRDFGAIGGLSVLLVLISSLVLGLFFSAVIPGIGLPLGIALGAVLSPTDAVATSVVKKLGISPRVLTMLEGESLLNDATALVLLRTAIAAAAAGAGAFSIWTGVGDFSLAVIIAVAIGLVVGWVNLRVRAWIPSTTAATAISFVVPYVAYLPTEHLGGSGLVAAVTAGIVTGQGATKYFTAEQRLSDRVNWRTIELVLEGAVFLIMGLEIQSIIADAPDGWRAVPHAALLALAAVAIILVLRTAYVIPLIWMQSRRSNRAEVVQPHLEKARDRFKSATVDQFAEHTNGRGNPERRMRLVRRRLARSLGDAQYLQQSRLGWREGTIIVWAGMRGAVTLAAAQTLPYGENRSLLILVAFLVAVGTLLLQGSTLAPLVRLLGLNSSGEDDPAAEELAELNVALRQAAATALDAPNLHRENGKPFEPDIVAQSRNRLSVPLEEGSGDRIDQVRELRLVTIAAQRQKLSAARSNGQYSTATLRRVLEGLDAEELSIRAHLAD